jgi:hypothetical protein
MKHFGLALAFVLFGSTAQAQWSSSIGVPPAPGTSWPTTEVWVLPSQQQSQPLIVQPTTSNPHPYDEMPIYKTRQMRQLR